MLAAEGAEASAFPRFLSGYVDSPHCDIGDCMLTA